MSSPTAVRSARRTILLLVAAVGLLVAPSAARAQAQSYVSATVVGDAGLDAWAVGGWLDGWFRRNLSAPATGAPAAVVAVVEGDRILVVRGYGWANLATRTPAGPGTIVRVGSLSKPVTATAVMQLVEAGLIDLSRPVSEYLPDLPWPAPVGRPIVVRDLVTHTAGLDVQLERTAAASDAAVLPLDRFLRERLPALVRPPGEVLSYSNHGYTLLGRLVEAVTGQAFDSYVARRIFQPLGMSSSGFRLTPAVQQRAAVGYRRAPEGFEPALVVHPHVYPAAGLQTTAEDMARFLLVHLNGGACGGQRLLSAASTAEMHRQQFTMGPGVPGIAFGFFEYPVRGQTALVHGGGIRGFMSALVIWPERRLGLFVANNGYSDWLVRGLVADFARRHLPAFTWPAGRREGTLERYAGSYRPASATRETLEKAGALRSGSLEVGVDDFRGRLTVGRSRFMPVGRGAFVETDGGEGLWVVDRRGAAGGLVVTADPVNGVVGWERVAWYQTGRCHREILFACSVLLLSALVVWRPYGRRPSAAFACRVLLAVVAGFDLVALGLFAGAFRSAAGAGMLLGLPALAEWALWLNAAAAVLCVPLSLGTWTVWRAAAWPVSARVHFTCSAAACLAFAGWSWHWNLLGI